LNKRWGRERERERGDNKTRKALGYKSKGKEEKFWHIFSKEE
jgi:hypothetical protein